MKRLAMVAAVVATLIVALMACPRSAQVRPASPPSPGAAPLPVRSPAAQPSGGPVEVTAPRAAEGVPPRPPEEGDAALRARLGLEQRAERPVAAAVMSATPAEHRLYAELERKAGSVPQGARDVVERRRAGATLAELQQLTKERLAGHLVAKATVLQWLAAEFGVEREPSPQGPPIVKPVGRK